MSQIHREKMKKLVAASLVILCVLGISTVGYFVWSAYGNQDKPGNEATDPTVRLTDVLVPLASGSLKVNAGDTVVVSIYASELDDVYGYQFNLHFNKDNLVYSQGLYSDIDEIQTIFATEKDQYLLVGATKIGAEAGYSGQLVQVCHIEFNATKDFILGPDSNMQYVSVSGANIVTSGLQYLTDTEGWTVQVSVK